MQSVTGFLSLGSAGHTHTHTHTHTHFLLASGDLPYYSAYHSLQGCDHWTRLSKGQIYSVWINSSSGLKSWVTPWPDFGFSLCLYTDWFFSLQWSVSWMLCHCSLWDTFLKSLHKCKQRQAFPQAIISIGNDNVVLRWRRDVGTQHQN